ncbi:MAG TPA: hypothetical protein VF042_14205 [Gemmatimonadaceae bacterium]
MSLAWGSLALLVVLLPGVLFFAGLRMPEKFTREAVERSALSQLAGVLLISLLIHGAFFISAPVWGWLKFPTIDISSFLTALTIEHASPNSVGALIDSIENHRFAILGYLILVASLGLFGGRTLGQLIVAGRFRSLGQHTWVNQLTVGDQYTTGWVLTNLREANRILMYRGFVHAAHLRKDGTFAYIVLTAVRKLYLKLGDDEAVTHSTVGGFVGEKTRQLEQKQNSDDGMSFVNSWLVVEGDDIANVMFDRYDLSFDIDNVTAKKFDVAADLAVTRFNQALEALAKMEQSPGETHQEFVQKTHSILSGLPPDERQAVFHYADGQQYFERPVKHPLEPRLVLKPYEFELREVNEADGYVHYYEIDGPEGRASEEATTKGK